MGQFDKAILGLYRRHLNVVDRALITEQFEQASACLQGYNQIGVSTVDPETGIFTLTCDGRKFKARLIISDENEEEVSSDDVVEREAEKRKNPIAQRAVQRRRALTQKAINSFDKQTAELEKTIR